MGAVSGQNVVVELKKPRAHIGAARIIRVLGSVEGSILASITALISKKPVRIVREEGRGNIRRIVMEVLV